MEHWAKDAILQHNACMRAAHILICEANGYCSNSQSEKLEAELAVYEVCPKTGDMITQATDD